MASLQASSSSELLSGSTRGYGGRWRTQPRCVLVFTPGHASGGARSSLVSKESKLSRSLNGQCSRRNLSRDGANFARWNRGWSSTCLKKKGEIKSALNDDDGSGNWPSEYRPPAIHASVESNSSEGDTIFNERVQDLVPFNAKALDGANVQVEVEERRRSTESQEWIQLGERRRSS